MGVPSVESSASVGLAPLDASPRLSSWSGVSPCSSGGTSCCSCTSSPLSAAPTSPSSGAPLPGSSPLIRPLRPSHGPREEVSKEARSETLKGGSSGSPRVRVRVRVRVRASLAYG